MNPWTILEIEQTTDVSQIKKAYSKKLKSIIPDEQPEAFQQLKLAFDTALKMAKETKSESPIIFIEDDNVVDSELADENYTDYEEDFINVELPFSLKLQLIVNEKDYSYNINIWEKLVEAIDEWTIDEFMANTYSIQLFLVDHFTMISREIIHFLFYTFELSDLRDYIGQENYVSQDFIILKDKIYGVPPFAFEIAQDIPNDRHEEYFNLRYSIYCMLEREEETHLIEEKLDKAKRIVAHDSDLLNMYILNILKLYHGHPKNKLIIAKIDNLLLYAEGAKENQTTEFLKSYILALNGNLTNPKIQEAIIWKKDQLVIPQKLYVLLTGYFCFFNHQYLLAFDIFKTLPLKEIIYLDDTLKKIKKQLPNFKSQEYSNLQIKIKKFKDGAGKEKVKVPVSTKIMFASFLFIIVLYVWVGLFNDDTSNQSNTSSTSSSEGIYKAEDLSKEELDRRFIETFYLSNDLEQKKQFQIDNMEDTVSIENAIQLSAHPKFKNASLSDFSIQKKELTVIYYRGEPINIYDETIFDKKLRGIYGEGWKRMEYLSLIEFDELDLPLDSLAEKFIYTFYVTDNPLLRDIFRLSFIYDDVSRKQMLDFVPAERYINSSMADFSFISKEKVDTENIETVYIRYKDSPMCTIRYYTGDMKPSIDGLLGDGWDFLNENVHFPIKIVDYEKAVEIFIQYILFSDKKQDHLAEYEEYFSDNLRSLVNDRLSIEHPENLTNTDLYIVKDDIIVSRNEEPILFIGYGNKVRLFFTFDDIGRLDHVYGDKWENGRELKVENKYTSHIQSIRSLLEEKIEK
ncbi:hypothetical protein A5880_002301 [Enterococcus sp. 4G2_DIV0659]|uniref:J domain-containing protein n=2 Tax=Candidatus Enterococcus mansonii TaxID=1834181 RepID=A0A242CH00_9ENTE|nr:hypothetical protein A5880_000203 [Enterococcus sp. 4G2_DIV0659]